MPFSFRLDPETAALIRRIARHRKWSQSAVVREAVAHYGAAQSAGAKAPPASAFDRLAAYVGVVNAHGANLSSDTHGKFRALLDRKHRARRPR
jgi:hypothetical protein